MTEIAEMKLSTKKPVSFYLRSAATFLRGTHDKKPVDELRISALGNAVSAAADVATRAETENLGKIIGIRTDSVVLGNISTPQLVVSIKRQPPIAIILHVEIKEDCVEEFIKVMTADAAGSRAEAGCLRFDLLRDKENPCKFTSYEVFASPEAIDAHKEMPHVKAWGCFQYGDKKPVVSKKLITADVENFQRNCPAVTGSPEALLLEVDIKDECIDDFVEVMQDDASGSRAEQGCLRFDFMRDRQNPNKFLTYEVFDSVSAMEIHRDTPHAKAWGCFQYGEKKPVISKSVVKAAPIDFQAPELLC